MISNPTYIFQTPNILTFLSYSPLSTSISIQAEEGLLIIQNKKKMLKLVQVVDPF